MIDIAIAAEKDSIRVNLHVVSRGQSESVVLYWYQPRNRIVASEYSAKIFTIADAIRYNRTDTSLVRVVVGVEDGNTRGRLIRPYRLCNRSLSRCDAICQCEQMGRLESNYFTDQYFQLVRSAPGGAVL